MQKKKFRRRDSQSRSMQRGVPISLTDLEGKQRQSDYSIPERDYREKQPHTKQVAPKLSLREIRPPLRQSNSLRSLDSEEWDSGGDDGCVKSLITPEERARVHRRLKSLERRSRRRNNMSTVEASTMDLTSLIANEEWKHVMRKIGSDPRSMSVKHTIELNGKRTRAFPLHHAVAHRPPVNVVDAMCAVFPDACRIPDDYFGQLPLHIACKHGAGSDVLRLLMNFFPDAVRLTDSRKRRLPLHYACNSGYPNDVSMLMEAERRALTARDANGKTPVDICQESKSPHRDAILKRIYEVSKYGGGVSGNKSSASRRKDRGSQAPSTPAREVPSPLPSESPSEVTVETSNVTKMGKAKSMLPKWASGRKGKSDMCSVPETIGAFPESPKKQQDVPQTGRDRSSSFERIKANKKTFDRFLGSDSRSLPSKMNGKQSRSLEKNVYPSQQIACKKPSPESSSHSSKSRKKKGRSREDSVPELGDSYGEIVSIQKEDSRGRQPEFVKRSSVPFDEAADREESLSDLEAPEVARHKKKGLSSNSDIRKLLDQEEKDDTRQVLGYDKLLSLPFGNSPEKQASQLDLSSSQKRLNGHRNLSPVQQQAARMSTRPSEAERGYQSMPIISRKASAGLSASPSEVEPGHRSMPDIAAPPLLSPSSTNNSSFQGANGIVRPSPLRPTQMLSSRSRPSTIPENGEAIDHETQVKQHHLELRKAALVEEYNHVSESIMKKRASAQMCKSKISQLESQIQELQNSLEREMETLDTTMSGIGLHEELLQEHEKKIQVVDQELEAIQRGSPTSRSAQSSEKESASVTTSGALGFISPSSSSGGSSTSSSCSGSSGERSSGSDSTTSTGTSSSRASSADQATLSFP